MTTPALRLRAERWLPGGVALARHDGEIVMLLGVIPGEVVEVSLHKNRGRLEGVPQRLLEPSPDRVDVPPDAPPTVDFGFLTYAAQLNAKRIFVEDVLARIAKLEADVGATMPSPLPWHYRNGAQYLVTRQGLAYRERNSHRAVRVRHDPLVTEAIGDGLGALRTRVLWPATEIAFRASFATREVLAVLVGNGHPREFSDAKDHLLDLGITGVALAQASSTGRFRLGAKTLAGPSEILERYGRFDFAVNASSFAQINPGATGELYEAAARLAGTGEHATDLYGGAGGLAAHLAGQFKNTTVLEISQEAIERGERNMRRLDLNVAFVRGDAQRLLALPRPDVVTLDPPRAGLSPEALAALVQARPERVVYVSCNAATWARDVGALARSGYALRQVQPWDFYPQTQHVEILSLLALG